MLPSHICLYRESTVIVQDIDFGFSVKISRYPKLKKVFFSKCLYVRMYVRNQLLCLDQ